MYIQRTPDRTEHDDFVLNVQHHIGKYQEAMPVYKAKTDVGTQDKNQPMLIGWKIQPMYD